MSASTLPRSFGSYTLVKLLARGGMGEIFLGRTSGLAGFQKYFALKKLLSKFVNDNDVTTRFIDEAKIGARLCHPNIVQVSDLGRIGDELYMAAEFVDGFDLRRILRFCHEKKKRIPLDVALFVVREVLSGLAYAHKQVDADGNPINLIHRDISPQNVLVSFEGEVKIIDFGLAKSTQRSQETQANVLLGNFGYMSPEQARGRKLDARTDVYSAGVVLFELVTGTKRFVDDNPLSLLEKVAHPAPIMPSERATGIPPAVDELYARAVDADLDKRFSGADAFRDEVTRILHRINPRATREHLSAFLEHLFLGGPAPATGIVDDDKYNNSVAIAVADLVADSEAFNAPKASDLANRRLLTAFDDDAPQTDSHDRMRAARLGDMLDERVLLGGEPKPMNAAAGASTAPAEESLDPASRPPMAATEEELDQVVASGQLPGTDPAYQVGDDLPATDIHDIPDLGHDEPTRVAQISAEQIEALDREAQAPQLSPDALEAVERGAVPVVTDLDVQPGLDHPSGFMASSQRIASTLKPQNSQGGMVSKVDPPSMLGDRQPPATAQQVQSGQASQDAKAPDKTERPVEFSPAVKGPATPPVPATSLASAAAARPADAADVNAGRGGAAPVAPRPVSKPRMPVVTPSAQTPPPAPPLMPADPIAPPVVTATMGSRDPHPQEFDVDIEDAAVAPPQVAASIAAPSAPSPFDQEPFHESLIIDFDDMKDVEAARSKADAPALPVAPPPQEPPVVPAPSRPPPLPPRVAVEPAAAPPAAAAPAATSPPPPATGGKIRPAANVRPLKASFSGGAGVLERQRRRRDAAPVIKRDETSQRDKKD